MRLKEFLNMVDGIYIAGCISNTEYVVNSLQELVLN